MLAIMEYRWTGLLTLALLSVSASLVDAHSWVEELTVVAPNGTFTGPKGYPRGNVFRSASFNDKMMQWQLPTNEASQLSDTMAMCRPSQQTNNNDAGSPALQAAPGDVIALRYQENGHVTLPWVKSGKPEHSGTVYVYGTDQPHTDEKFTAIHKVWNLDGSGGDRRGKLLSTQFFDDGQCYQINPSYISVDRQGRFPRKPEAGSVEGADVWCQTDIALPKDVKSDSKYTLYWVWDWPTLNTHNTTYLYEAYTTCIDIDVIASDPQGSSSHTDVSFAQVTNYGDAAIQSIFDNVKTLGTQTVQTQPSTGVPSSPGSPAAAAGTPIASAPAPAAPSTQTNTNCGTPMTVTVGATTVTTTTSLPGTTATITTTVTITASALSQPKMKRHRRFSA